MPTILPNSAGGNSGVERNNCIGGMNNGTNGSGGGTAGSNNGSGGSSNNCGNNIIGNNNIYENDSNLDERQCMLLNGSMNCDSLERDRHSDCCSSSKDDHDDGGDTCCSCSESSCLYAEAGDPTSMHQVQIIQMGAPQTAN